MKKQEFLSELIRKRKLIEVEPSEDIKNSYMKKSESSLISAKILLENNRLEESVSLAYYSMYHAVTALFFRVGIKCENHSATIILLKNIFEIDNNPISFAKSERVDKQYYTNFEINKKEVEETIKIAEDFNSDLADFLARLKNEEIHYYLNKFKSLLNTLI